MANYRRGRINDEMQKELSALLREIKDPRVSGGMVSITAAQVISARILGLRCEGDFIFSGQRRASASRMNELKTCFSIGAHYASGSFRTRAPRCPHMGCRMKFNPSTRLWECPCHGSRFDGIGHWRNGPAVHDAIIRRK